MRLEDLNDDTEEARVAREAIRDRVQNHMGSPVPARDLRPGDRTAEGEVTKVTFKGKRVIYTTNRLTKHKHKPDELIRLYALARGVWARAEDDA